jgi:MraZ protein
MPSFRGTHENRLDAKGRVSIPAQFRAVLREGLELDAPIKLMLRPSDRHDCMECWPIAKFELLARSLDGLDPLSAEYEDRASVIYGDTTDVDLDKEGRIALTPAVVAKAKITGRVAFVGMGDQFHLWEPDALQRRLIEARENFRQRDQTRLQRAAS